MDVSIIFVNYNTCQLTCEAIDSVYQFTKSLDFEIIMVDNNSQDDSVESVTNRFPDVRIVENDKNLGFGKANNLGMKMAKGKYIFLLNTDTYLINNAIEILYDYMEHNSHVAICGGKLLTPELTYNVSAGNFPNYKLFVKGSFLKYFYPRRYYTNAVRKVIPTEKEEPYDVDYVSGADFFVRKEIIDQVGGFDERFFM